MEVLPKDVVLEFHEDTLSGVRKIHGLDEPGKMRVVVDALEEWVQKQEHFLKKDFSRHYLETTIISSKGLLQRAQKRLQNVCRQRREHPQYFGDFVIKNDFQEFHGIITHAVLPKQTKEYNRVLLIRNIGKKFQSNFILQVIRIYIMMFEYLKIHDYSDGLILIADLREVSLMEAIRKMNLFDLRQAASILIEGYGVRVKGLHILSTSRIINLLVWILKQVLSAKLIGRIQVHQGVETLHNVVPKHILPVDYNGEEKALGDIHDQWYDVLSTAEFRSYLTDMLRAKCDESLLQTDDPNQIDITNLNVD
ncbi:alpha-tocopherol transfer protein-like [Pectinophora gossypiella]|uniref:alpha-tocopherol transfer protein-like n=1 Tax=Pectinophora gossypiella TaxID=13191 RepID=UPI00214E8870|nr:alpha-tocopherol transfer protein-like [Pectinophora gossypiella]XP_049870219.1 alpha-tocopherol transfer protein-like [Pectinophora gossypiella]XP_049870220.1 alpha-tocopherol transfer protein-like [Pectinophora gossypiella]